MNIKEFKKNQKAYMLIEKHGYNKKPEVKIVTVLSVGMSNRYGRCNAE